MKIKITDSPLGEYETEYLSLASIFIVLSNAYKNGAKYIKDNWEYYVGLIHDAYYEYDWANTSLDGLTHFCIYDGKDILTSKEEDQDKINELIELYNLSLEE